jgi:hypothetical protein
VPELFQELAVGDVVKAFLGVSFDDPVIAGIMHEVGHASQGVMRDAHRVKPVGVVEEELRYGSKMLRRTSSTIVYFGKSLTLSPESREQSPGI